MLRKLKSTFFECIILAFLIIVRIDVYCRDNVAGMSTRIGTWKGTAGRYVAGELILRVASNSDRVTLDSLLQANGMSLIGRIDQRGWCIARGDTSLDVISKIGVLTQRPDFVIHAEPNAVLEFLRIPSDTLFNQLWGLDNIGQQPLWVPDADIDCPEAWEITTGDTCILLGVLDTGIVVDPGCPQPGFLHPEGHGGASDL